MNNQEDIGDISKLLDIMAALRDPETGCPWDLEQTFATIAPYTIEEACEVADCIEREALDELPDELGDLLFQVVFHARMASEQDLFDFADVVHAICSKMVRRHPHVFGDRQPGSGQEVMASWERIKRAEKPDRESQLDGVAVGLPALARAAKLGRRAAAVGFDWPSADDVRAKLDEELGELDQAVAGEGKARIEAELGDLLFTVANYARHLQIDPEQALRRASQRFTRRFQRVEGDLRESGGHWERQSPEDLDALWASAKSAERD